MTTGSIFEEAYVRFHVENAYVDEPIGALPASAVMRQVQQAYGTFDTRNDTKASAFSASPLSDDEPCPVSAAGKLTPQKALQIACDIVRGKQPYDSQSGAMHAWFAKDLLPKALSHPELLLGTFSASNPETVYDACRYQSYTMAIQWMRSRQAEGLQSEDAPSQTSMAYQQQVALQQLLADTDFCLANQALQQQIETFLGVVNPKDTLSGLSNCQEAALTVLSLYDDRLKVMLKSALPLTKSHIKSAYRRILKQYHPDQAKAEASGAIIRQANAAYQELRPVLAA